MKLSFRTRLDRAPRRRHANPIQRTIDRRLGGAQAPSQCDRQGDGRAVLVGRRPSMAEVHRRTGTAEDEPAYGIPRCSQDGADSRRVRTRAPNDGDIRSTREIGARWRRWLVAGLTACLAACGGEKPADTAAVKQIAPAVVSPATPASEASAPVAASIPAASVPVASEPAAFCLPLYPDAPSRKSHTGTGSHCADHQIKHRALIS